MALPGGLFMVYGVPKGHEKLWLILLFCDFIIFEYIEKGLRGQPESLECGLQIAEFNSATGHRRENTEYIPGVQAVFEGPVDPVD